MFGITEVGAIVVICYLIGEIVKVSPLDNKYIPCTVGFFGGILGAVAFLTGAPDFPAQDILNAIAVGIVSGLAATGANQVVKQFKK
jgi:hypothetical protein